MTTRINSSNTPRAASSFPGSGLMSQSTGGFADPLATTGGGFGDVDPWSGTQSPARAETPQSSIEAGLNTGNGGDGTAASVSTPALDALIGTPPFPSLPLTVGDPPESYIALFRQLEPGMSGKVSIPAIQRLLSTSRLPASTVEKVCGVRRSFPRLALNRRPDARLSTSLDATKRRSAAPNFTAP